METNEGLAIEGSEENENEHDGIVRELGELGEGAIITEKALARLFDKHPDSIKRAVQRKELPQPVKLMGKPSWTAGSIVKHIEQRLHEAAQEAEKEERRLMALAPGSN